RERGLLFDAPGTGWPVYDDMAIDTLPVVRHYFAAQLRKSFAKEWQEAHRALLMRLRPFVRKSAASLGEMRPAFLAVHHAAQANLYDDATALYFMRIRQGRHDRLKQLGRYREELELLGYFF